MPTISIKKFIIFIVTTVLIVIINAGIISYAIHNKIQKETKPTKIYTVGLLFGTNKKNKKGTSNIYFSHRIQKAVELYQQGTIEYILVSGDRNNQGYNEPRDMHDALVDRGVPSDHIVLDYAGFSTWDSIARAKIIFQAPDLLLISQQFQVERGLIACRYFDMNCHGSTTENISFTIAPKIYVREYGARIKLWYDLFNPQSSLEGKKEKTPWNNTL